MFSLLRPTQSSLLPSTRRLQPNDARTRVGDRSALAAIFASITAPFITRDSPRLGGKPAIILTHAG